MSSGKIKLNSAMCLVCDDTIVSKHSHDYVTCNCGALSVDGGLEYLKRNFVKMEDWIEMSEYEEIKDDPSRKRK